jgi:uncharacterized protein YjbI with pentapeptide repeats
MADNPLQKRWKAFRNTFRRYTPLLWRFPEARKNIIQVVWRRPLLIVKWLFIVVAIIVLPILLVKVILLGYSLPFTGFNAQHVPDPKQYQPAKTLWDWLQLLIIPAVLAVGGTIFNRLLNERSRDIATDQQQETALQNYLKEMSDLLTTNKLKESEPGSPERDIARARTLTVLPGLDPLRKGRVLRFLYETGLIFKNNTIVDLRGTNFSNLRIHETKLSSNYLQMTGTRLSLRNANLQGAIFRDASLEQVDLRGACLDEAYITYVDLNSTWLCQTSMKMTRLHGSSLYRACLRGAQMQGANLRGAYLREADLRKVNLQKADLRAANLQKGRLEGALLQRADLREADLRGADLKAAQLKGAIFQRTRLCYANVTDEQRKIVSGARFKKCKDASPTSDHSADASDTPDHNCNDVEFGEREQDIEHRRC